MATESNACNGHQTTNKEEETPDTVVCPECHTELTGSENLRDHIQPGLYLRKDLCCRKCLAVFASECSFQAHSRIHDNKAPYVCPECGLELSNGLGRDQHMLTHRDERWLTKAWMCPVCYKHYNSTRELLSHLIAIHTELLFSCEPCNRLLHSISAFERHCQQKHGKEVERQPNVYYACGILTCSWKTRSREELKLHFDGHLTVPSDLPRCFCCGRIYQTEADLVNHQTTYHTEDAISEPGYNSTRCLGSLAIAQYNRDARMNRSNNGLLYGGAQRRGGSGASKRTRFDRVKSEVGGETLTVLLDGVQPPLSCLCCGMLAPEKKILLEHGQDHIKAGSPVCLVCKNMPFDSDLALRQHLRMHCLKEVCPNQADRLSQQVSPGDYLSVLRVLHLQA